MNQSLIQLELEGEAKTANQFDIIDYLAHSSAKVPHYIWISEFFSQLTYYLFKQGNLYHAFELTKILLEMGE